MYFFSRKHNNNKTDASQEETDATPEETDATPEEKMILKWLHKTNTYKKRYIYKRMISRREKNGIPLNNMTLIDTYLPSF